MKQAIVDLAQHNWHAEIGSKDGCHSTFYGNRQGDENEVGATVEIGGVQHDLDFDEMVEFAGYAIMSLFLSQDLPASAVPEPLRGDMRASAMWAHLQAQHLLPLIVQRVLSNIQVGGKRFGVDFSFTPNVSSGNIVAIDGSKKSTWDGSFRPILRLTPVEGQPEYEPKEMEPA